MLSAHGWGSGARNITDKGIGVFIDMRSKINYFPVLLDYDNRDNCLSIPTMPNISPNIDNILK